MFLPGALVELDRAAGKDWQPPDAETELRRVTDSLQHVAGEADIESALARKVTAEALAMLRAALAGRAGRFRAVVSG
ncbi:MAG: hypothetical protein JNL62_26930 [Bryobacterales bacterium]|nr:hypothetical protein [Bryobacterales bacterium]